MQPTRNQADITLTDAARDHLRAQLQRASAPWLRLSLREAGCSGLEYHWEAVEAPAAGDLRIGDEDLGLNLCVDAVDHERALRGLIIDFERDPLSATLTYRNPNQRGTCGCGQSFTVD
ncbi:MAG: iron-sulfur cluster assembly accessory protein [Zetaproteobacteria bacterium]|nr:MAG: iron-sulfur cluster assembly accessory protein [Zetaproteobacteria bacterium]